MPMIRGCYTLVMKPHNGLVRDKPIDGRFEDKETIERLGQGISDEMNAGLEPGGYCERRADEWVTARVEEVAGCSTYNDEDALIEFALKTDDPRALRGALRVMNLDERGRYFEKLCKST